MPLLQGFNTLALPTSRASHFSCFYATIIHFFSTIPCDALVDRSSIALFMLLFSSTLIAVTVTDFKENLFLMKSLIQWY